MSVDAVHDEFDNPIVCGCSNPARSSSITTPTLRRARSELTPHRAGLASADAARRQALSEGISYVTAYRARLWLVLRRRAPRLRDRTQVPATERCAPPRNASRPWRARRRPSSDNSWATNAWRGNIHRCTSTAWRSYSTAGNSWTRRGNPTADLKSHRLASLPFLTSVAAPALPGPCGSFPDRLRGSR